MRKPWLDGGKHRVMQESKETGHTWERTFWKDMESEESVGQDGTGSTKTKGEEDADVWGIDWFQGSWVRGWGGLEW